MIEYDFEGYAKYQIDRALSYSEEMRQGYIQSKEEVKQDQSESLTENGIYRLGYHSGYKFGEAYAKANVKPKEWVGLTGEEIWEACMESPVELDCSADELYVISRIIEAKLKEKNK